MNLIKRFLLCGLIMVMGCWVNLGFAAKTQTKTKAQTQTQAKPHTISDIMASIFKSPSYKIFNNYVAIAPYTGTPTYNTGTALIVNSPSIYEDAKLLFRRYVEQQALLKSGEPMPAQPRLVLSGKVEGQAIYKRPYSGPKSTDIDLSGAELDTFAELSPWFDGFMDMNYDNSVGSTPRRMSNSNVSVDKAFLTVGNFNESAFYGSLGQLYVPFGRYSSNMISDPLTKFVGKTKARAATIGYAPQMGHGLHGINASAFLFKGDSYYGGSDFAKQFGLDASYRWTNNLTWYAEAGASYINNLGDSVNIQDNGSSTAFKGFDKSSNEKLDHRVGGFDMHGVFAYKSWNFLAEYVTAMKKFSSNDLSFNGHGAKPYAWNVEGAYVFMAWKKPSSIALGYGQSSEALALNAPRQRIDAIWSINIVQNVIARIEFRHDINYASHDTATGQGLTAYNASELGHSSNTITAELGMYF